MTQSVLASTAALVRDLAPTLTGRLITPDDRDYDEGRQVYNAAIDRKPALIVRAAGPADVSTVVSLAREHGIELAVRGGTHGFAGYATSEGGIVLDLLEMNDLEIDAGQRTVWAQAGATAGQVTAAAAEHGLAPVFGDTGSVGIAGITLGGGMGWLVRKHGLTIDNLLAAEVVTADGALVRADADEHPDLFWALRGGGGNVGVVTRLQYRLHPVDEVYGGMLVLPATARTVRAFVEAASAAPEDLSAIAIVGRMPPLPFLPEAVHGQVAMVTSLVYAGDPEQGEQAVAPLRAIAEPLADMVGPTTYAAMFPEEAGPPRASYAVRSTFVDDLDEATAADMVERLNTSPATVATFQIRVMGGAVSRVAADATAFAHRGRAMMVSAGAGYDSPDLAVPTADWVDGVVASLPGASGAFVNFLSNGDDGLVREAYPEPTYSRLAAIKRRYDPTNLFRLNTNVAPAAS